VALSSPSSLRFSDAQASPLRLLAYMTLALALMTADMRGSWLSRVRQQATLLVGPIYWLAAVPSRLLRFTGESLQGRDQLLGENRRLRDELLITQARERRLLALADENRHLRDLLGGTHGMQLGVRLATIIDVDLDPGRQQVVLDLGASDGVAVGQAFIDASGLLGQVTAVAPGHATALLITDPDHAIPVQVVRSGLRVIAYGTGERDRLEVRDIPQSGDIRENDELITSGIGGNFPAGFAVGRVTGLRQDESQLFSVADLAPAAAVARAHQVLLVWAQPATVDIGPPPPPSTQPQSSTIEPNEP
jgi:rod shape-determining protein MreC